MKSFYLLFIIIFCASPAMAGAQDAPAIDGDGIVHVPAYDLPLSPRLSPEARKALTEMIRSHIETAKQHGADTKPPQAPPTAAEVAKTNQDILKGAAPVIAKLRARYPVRIEPTEIDGLRGMDIAPEGGVSVQNSNKILIELHPGGFKYGSAADMGAEEAIPVAALTGIRVIALDYRQGPVDHFPAASEDVAKLYRYLLRTYAPENIGIFGGSAGGLLTAQALAWFDHEHLPMPGAAGIFFASADARWDGDSIWAVPGALGYTPPDPRGKRPYDEASYYGETPLDDPLMSPIQNPAVLAKFPPTLIISATRADDMGSAVNTHRILTDLGVKADLQLWSGMWHCFYLGSPDVPESRAAYRVMANFFRRHLGSKQEK